MPNSIEKQLADLINRDQAHYLAQLQRGLEKESLRVDPSGLLAQTPHPEKLGSALTHPSITTDYSEALLEFVTPVHRDVDQLLAQLYDIHHYTYRHLGDEKLWVNSMPCIVEGEQAIPIARYGKSNIAKMKEAYRRGLGHRYGRLMQTIAGIHFNFSLPDDFWRARHGDGPDSTHLQSASYFGLIRNFHRLSWIGCYLFGASPAVCKSFLAGRDHMLEDYDQYSFFAPNATSLRLSGLGYSNNAQADIQICYNSVQDFAQSLRSAIQTPNPKYQSYGLKVDGQYQQLNANLLQIENEFYSVIRPKRVTHSGESPTHALNQRGVQYVEVRSLDLNPFEPTGIDKTCIHFFDLLLIYCLLDNSDQLSEEEWAIAADNRNKVVLDGRSPSLILNIKGKETPFATAALEVLDQLAPIAQLLDQLSGKGEYQHALDAQVAKVQDAALTPSAKIIAQMSEDNASFFQFAMKMAAQHETAFKQRPMDEQKLELFRHQAKESHEKQLEIEQSDDVDFDTFLADYFKRQNQPWPEPK